MPIRYTSDGYASEENRLFPSTGVDIAPVDQPRLPVADLEPSAFEAAASRTKRSVIHPVFGGELHKPDPAAKKASKMKVSDVMQALIDSDNRYQTWPEKIVRSGTTLLRDVYQGKVDPLSEEGIARAQDTAGLAVAGEPVDHDPFQKQKFKLTPMPPEFDPWKNPNAL